MPDEIEMPNEALERHEQLHEGAHGEGHEGHGNLHGAKITFLILLLAMAAAIGGKISSENEIHYLTYEIDSTDTWAQYQGKADREAMALGFARLAGLLPNAGDPAVQAAIADWKGQAAKLESDPDNAGKKELAVRGKELSDKRDIAASRMEGFSLVVVLLALAIGLGSASMLSKTARPRVVLAAVSGVTGIGATIFLLLIALGIA